MPLQQAKSEGPRMDTSTQTHLKQQRDSLLYRQRELQADLHAAELARQAQAPAGEAGVVDQKDMAERWQASDLDSAQQQRDAVEAQQVAAALQRLDEGRYGDCQDCGQPIPFARLRVQPAALRCASCQAAFEHAAEFARR
jgi:DnaK suppressor protein